MCKHVWLVAFSAMVFLPGAALGQAGPKPPMEVPTTGAAFDKIIAALKPQAEAFAKAGDDKGPTLSQVIKRVQYSPKSAQPLSNALTARLGDPLAEMYVAYQLLQPLTRASNETIQPVKPVLLRLLGQRCRHKTMPRWPKGTLTTLNPPADLPPDKLMGEMQRIQKIRDQKLTAERPVAKHNRMVRQLERTIKNLLAMLGDNPADEALLQRLGQEYQHKLITYEDTLAAIKAEAGRMKQARAKKLYKQIKHMAFQAGAIRQHYTDPTAPNYSITGNSGFHARQTYFAVSALTVVNLLATPAKEPAVPIPDVKKYEKQQKRARQRRH